MVILAEWKKPNSIILIDKVWIFLTQQLKEWQQFTSQEPVH